MRLVSTAADVDTLCLLRCAVHYVSLLLVEGPLVAIFADAILARRRVIPRSSAIVGGKRREHRTDDRHRVIQDPIVRQEASPWNMTVPIFERLERHGQVNDAEEALRVVGDVQILEVGTQRLVKVGCLSRGYASH